MPQDPAIHRFFHKKESAADFLAERVEALRQEICQAKPEHLAWRTGSTFHPRQEGSGSFHLDVWGRTVELDFPDFEARYAGTKDALDTFTLAMLAYYFHTADGTQVTGTWISFADLPDGRFYAQAFQGYSGDELASHFGNDAARLEQAARRLGGRKESWGDHAYSFQALPRVPLLVVCWLGDEDFPPSYRVLFDTSAANQLTTDACAVLGGRLASRLIKAGTA